MADSRSQIRNVQDVPVGKEVIKETGLPWKEYKSQSEEIPLVCDVPR